MVEATIRTGDAAGLAATLLIAQREAVTQQTRAEAAEAKLQAAQAEAAELRKALERHHNWHLTSGPLLIKDDHTGEIIELDGPAEYADSSMCAQTIAALSASPAPALAVIEAALEVKPHIDAWRNALTIVKVRAQEKGDDEAIAYWAHEERAGLRDGGALVAACDAYTKHTEGAG